MHIGRLASIDCTTKYSPNYRRTYVCTYRCAARTYKRCSTYCTLCILCKQRTIETEILGKVWFSSWVVSVHDIKTRMLSRRLRHYRYACIVLGSHEMVYMYVVVSLWFTSVTLVGPDLWSPFASASSLSCWPARSVNSAEIKSVFHIGPERAVPTVPTHVP